MHSRSATTGNTASWSSLECSPACHAGDRGFKSHRGRLENGVVRKTRAPCTQGRRRSSNLRDCEFDSRLRHFRVVLLTAACKAVVVKEVRWMTKGSIPSQPTYGPFVYRFRMPAPHAGATTAARRCPVRFPHGLLTQHDHVVELADTRRSERRALEAWEFNSPHGH